MEQHWFLMSEFFIMTEPTFNSTAIYKNRIEDKRRVEQRYAITEQGNRSSHFYLSDDTLFAVGYERIVYGDHGPYVEFELDDIVCPITPLTEYGDLENAYYQWMVPTTGPKIKVYRQLRSVRNLRNPPSGGFRGNRKEGYADYIPGLYYVDPYQFGLILDYDESYA